MDRLQTVGDFFDQYHDALGLMWWQDSQRYASVPMPIVEKYASYLGYLNPVHPTVCQIIGDKEQDYLQSLSSTDLFALLNLLHTTTACVFVGSDGGVSDTFAQQCQRPILTSNLPSDRLFERLYADLPILFAARHSCHGVLMSIFGIGVLITGKSGIGKSQLALSLLHRGHLLVADDAPTFIRLPNNDVMGYAAYGMAHFLFVRQLGLVDVSGLYGRGYVKHQQRLAVVLHLCDSREHTVEYDSVIDGNKPFLRSFCLHEQSFPQLMLTVPGVHRGPIGQDLSVLTEAKIKQFMMLSSGVNVIEQFEQHLAGVAVNSADNENSE